MAAEPIFSNIAMTFKDKGLEAEYQSQKIKYQIVLLKFFIVYCLTASIVIWMIINPFDLSPSDFFMIMISTGKVTLIIVSIYVIKRKRNYVQLLWIGMLLSVFVIILENIKYYRSKIEHFPYVFFSWGIITQIFFFTNLLTRTSLLHNVSVSITFSIYVGFRFIDMEHNTSTRFFPLICQLINLLFLITFAYVIERYERLRFYEIKKHEKSQSYFEGLIRDIIPSSIIIANEMNIVYCNEIAKRRFNLSGLEINVDDLKNLIVYKNNLNIQGEGTNSDALTNFFQIGGNMMNNMQGNSNKFSEAVYLKSPSTLYDLLLSQEFQKLKTYKYIGHLRREGENSFLEEEEPNATINYMNITIGHIIWKCQPSWIIILNDDPSISQLMFMRNRDLNKDKMLATVSHDLRTPLNGVIGMIASTIDDITDKKLRKRMKIALNSSQHLLSLINDILDFSQISNGKLRLNFNEINIEKTVKEALNILKIQAKGKDIDLLLENKINSELKITNDSTRLKQVLLNLLGNALKFTDRGHIKLILEESKHKVLTETVNTVKFTVEDTGCGISSEEIPRLFQFFGRLENEDFHRVNKTGVGLGLAISQKLVRHMNNYMNGLEINVDSEKGRGTKFTFELLTKPFDDEKIDEELVNKFMDSKLSPYQSKDIKSLHSKLISNEYTELISDRNLTRGDVNMMTMITEGESILKEPANVQLSSKKRILLVEDDQINILVATNYLNKINDIEFDVVKNGLEAVNKVKDLCLAGINYSLILMDCNTPVMDGFEASRLITEFNRARNEKIIPIIALTASTYQESYKLSKQAGMLDFLVKPYSFMDLQEKIKKILKI